MSGFEVREAGPEDFEAVATLLAELGRPAVMGGREVDGHRDRYLRYLEDPNLHVFVAEEDGEVVGMIDLELLPRLNFTTRMAWVPDLIVTEARRSGGVGAALLARAEEAARRAGAWALTLESANWRAGAHAFYLREGMDDSAHSFTKVLRTDLGWPPAPVAASGIVARPLHGIAVRPAAEADLEAVNDIYNHYVVDSHVTFDVEPTTMDRRKEWFGHYGPTGRHRLMAAESDSRVVGYAGSSQFRPKPGYDTTVETSVYVAPDSLGQGVGVALFEALFEALRGEDVHRALAGIALPNPASVRLHQRFGFRRVAFYTEQGRKFDRYWDVAWYQKDL
jgi:phosphinothricin acetyltransferase